MYVNPLKDIKSSYFRKVTAVNWCNVDECGYNIWTARSQGRAIRGERAYRQVCGQRGRNLTVALAISPTAGLVFHSAIIGGMNAQRFADFLTQTRLHLDPDEQVVFIYDGAPAHHNPGNPGPNTAVKKLIKSCHKSRHMPPRDTERNEQQR